MPSTSRPVMLAATGGGAAQDEPSGEVEFWAWSTNVEELVALLVSREIPGIGFVNENKLEVDGRLDPGRVELLEFWLTAGLELGNHSYSHPDLHSTPLENYLTDILRGERVTRPLLEATDLELRYFRHPFLHTGTDLKTRQAVGEFLEQHGYRVAPVTIDNSEWIFVSAAAFRFRRARPRHCGRSYREPDPRQYPLVSDDWANCIYRISYGPVP